MSEVRTLTAAQLAADDEPARAVWDAVRRRESKVWYGKLCVERLWDYAFGNRQRPVFLTNDHASHFLHVAPETPFEVVLTPLGEARAKLAAIEAWAAAQPDTPPLPPIMDGDSHAYAQALQVYAREYARYVAGHNVRALLKGEAP